MNAFKVRRCCWIIAFVLSLGLATGQAGHAAKARLPGEGIPIQPVDGGILEEVFQLEIVLIGLRRLGYTIKPTIVLPQEAGTPHLLVAQGDADFFAGHWDPLHMTFFQAVGGDKTVKRIGLLVEGCMQGYLIDKRTAERYTINNLGQFSEPRFAKLFDSDGNGKADLAGCHPGWGCWRVIEHQLTAYGLRDTVEHHQNADYFEMIQATIRRYRSGEPIFYYTWTPLWVSGVLKPGIDVVWLTVPFTALPRERTEMDTTLPDGRNLGFAINRVRILANNEFLRKNPAAERFFELVRIPIEDISAENMLIHSGERKMTDIKRHAEAWIETRSAVFDSWIEEASKAAQ